MHAVGPAIISINYLNLNYLSQLFPPDLYLAAQLRSDSALLLFFTRAREVLSGPCNLLTSSMMEGCPHSLVI